MWEREAGHDETPWYFLGVTDYIILAEGRRKKGRARGRTGGGGRSEGRVGMDHP